MNKQGAIYTRKPKGKKLSFCVGGPTLDEALTMARGGTGLVFVWVGFDGEAVEFSSVNPPVPVRGAR